MHTCTHIQVKMGTHMQCALESIHDHPYLVCHTEHLIII